MTTTCHRGPAGQRLVGPNHDADHDNCEPCPHLHCVLCGTTHTDDAHPLTCPGCIGNTRDTLHAILELRHQLRAHAWHGGQDGHLEAARPIPGGEAMAMLGPVAHPEAWSWRVVTACMDRAGDTGWLDDNQDDRSPLWVLGTWEIDWRDPDWLDLPSDLRITVERAAAFLNTHLGWAAQHHDAFDEFAADLAGCRTRLEAILHAGDRPDTGAPCLHCKADLIHQWHREGKADEWSCPRCRRTYSAHHYAYAVGVAYRAHAPALNAADMADQHGISRGSLTGWASLGKVRRRGRDLTGRVLYDVADARACAGHDTPGESVA